MTEHKGTMIVVGHDHDSVVIIVEDVEAELSIRLGVKDARKLIQAIDYQIACMRQGSATTH